MSIGQKLKLIRKDQKKNQKEFANILQISERTYWSYENDSNDVSIFCLQKLREIFDVDINCLIDDSCNDISMMYLSSKKQASIENSGQISPELIEATRKIAREELKVLLSQNKTKDIQ